MIWNEDSLVFDAEAMDLDRDEEVDHGEEGKGEGADDHAAAHEAGEEESETGDFGENLPVLPFDQDVLQVDAEDYDPPWRRFTFSQG